jgi:hypothetical protein
MTLEMKTTILSQLVITLLIIANRLCFVESWWWDLLPFSILSFMFYVIGTIVASTYVELKAGELRKFRKSLARGTGVRFTFTQMFLLDMTDTDYQVYKPDYFYWDGVVMVRKLLIGAVVSLMTSTPKSQCVLLIFIMQISLFIQTKRKPFLNDELNDMEEFTLSSTTVILLVGLIVAAKERTDPVFITFLSVAVIGHVSGSCVRIFWKFIYNGYHSLGAKAVKPVDDSRMFAVSSKDRSSGLRDDRGYRMNQHQGISMRK